MPQASSELRAKWPGHDDQAISFLCHEREFVLTQRWTWVPPNFKTWKELDDREQSAINYMCDEWDFGGLE